MNKKIKVSVIGLGFVGAAMSIAIASVKIIKNNLCLMYLEWTK